MDEEKLIILVQGHEYLYNLQHQDYDNNLVKDTCWKEIAREVHAQGKEQATRYFVHYRKAHGDGASVFSNTVFHIDITS
jgi:hypothetical protein